MKWYQVIHCDNLVKHPFIANEGSMDIDVTVKFTCNGKVSSWDSSEWVRATTTSRDGELDDVLQTYLPFCPIFSKPLRDALTESGIQDIQYLPIRVLGLRMNEHFGYAIANILPCAAVLDEEVSILTRYTKHGARPDKEGEISGLKKAVLKRELLENVHFIRSPQFRWSLFASEVVYKLFRKNRFTGFGFTEVKTV